MPLVLAVIVLFILIGVGTRRFDWRQQALVVFISIALAAIQFRVHGAI